MALKDTIKKMHASLEGMVKDLGKGERGNKTAAQRVRTESVKFAKLAKQYRKESVKSEKSPKAKKKTTRKKTTSKKVARKKPVAKKKAPVRKTKKKTAAKRKRS